MLSAHPDKDRLVPPAGWQQPGAAATSAETPPINDGPPAEGDATAAADEGGHAAALADLATPADQAGAVDADMAALVHEVDDEGDANDEAGDEVTPVLRNDGMERGSLARGGAHARLQTGSVSTRIAALYASMAEAGNGKPCVDAGEAHRPSFFDTDALLLLRRFIVTCGGTGLTRADQILLARVLLAFEPETRPIGDVNSLADRLPTPHFLVTAVAREERRVLADRSWLQVFMDVGHHKYMFFYRDALDAVFDVLKKADDIELDGKALPAGPAGETRRSRTMDSDLFLAEQEDVRRIHGPDAKVLGVMLHADEAVISWNGAGYVYPIRVFVVNVRGGTNAWVTVGYIPHISKVIGNGRNALMRQAVSDARNDMLQRCLAVVMRQFVRASEHGARVQLSAHGSVLLVPRVVGLVVDQVQEREIMGLMGHQCTYNCTHCMTRRDESCTFGAEPCLPRPVVATLEAQLSATIARLGGCRPTVRAQLGSRMSALPFVPALGAIHGLGTGAARLYDIVSFDTLHVWKLGVLRTLAQRLPGMLSAVCSDNMAVEGSVQQTLDAVNARGFELGRLCRASPSSPGYVVYIW